MVRSISAASQAKLDQDQGTEPALIIEIQWVDGGSIYTYSDKDLGADEGRILEVSGLDSTVVVQGVQSGTASDSQQISVTLDDTNGSIKDIIDSHDVHKEPAWVYQWFQGLDTSEKFLVFKGQISSPIQWNEGDRTISFDIINRIEDAEVGFSMEEGNFEFVPENLVGKPWPLIFGTVKTCPALQTRSPRKGILKTGFGIRDYMLDPKLEQLQITCCPTRFAGFRVTNETTVWGSTALRMTPIYQSDPGCVCKRRTLKCQLEARIALESQFEFDTIEIIDGEFFPQGKFIRLNIAGAIVSGSFNGTEENPSRIFNISNRIHPKKVLGDPVVPEIKRFACASATSSASQNVGSQSCNVFPNCFGFVDGVNQISSTGGTNEQTAWGYLSTFEEAGFFWAEPGSEVTLVGDDSFVYVANLLPSTVHQVKAYRTFSASNLRQFTTVPNSFYTVRQSDFNGYIVTEIVFDRPLSERGEGWENDIFVTLTSSIGPNPVDIMEWLIDKYTSFTWDSSFASVKTKVDNYPMNFMVPGRMNILQLLQEMAFQGRMALVLRNDEFHLIYLSEEPNEDEDITEDDVLANSLVLDHTDTEDLVTKLVAEWRPECHLEDPYKVILRYNIRKYGTQEKVFSFYTYNIQELVIKSATFWLIRMANTWRKIICQTPINKLALESLDGVFVTLPDIANGTIKCRVETATYNSDDHAIDFVIQTPVRSGEKDAFPFHYPAGIDIELLHPTTEDIQFGNAGGTGPNVDVEAPEGHSLGSGNNLPQGFSFGQKSPCENLSEGVLFNRPLDIQGKCRPDHGDQQPSDIDDTKPAVQLEDDNSVIPPSQSPVNERTETDIVNDERDLQQEGRDGDLGTQATNNLNLATGAEDGAATGNAGAGGTDANADQMKQFLDELPSGEELTEQNKCWYSLRVFYLNPVTVVRIGQGESCNPTNGSPFTCNASTGCFCNEPGKVGCVVGNQVLELNEVFYFDTAEERDAFQSSIETLINTKGTVGSIHPASFQRDSHVPPDCEGAENPDQGTIIGFEGSGDDSKTIVGLQGFMTDQFDPEDPCDI